MEENKLAAIIANTPVTYEHKFDETKFTLTEITQNFEGGETVVKSFIAFPEMITSKEVVEPSFVLGMTFKRISENLQWDDLDRFKNIQGVLKGTAKAYWNNKIATDQAIVGNV